MIIDTHVESAKYLDSRFRNSFKTQDSLETQLKNVFTEVYAQELVEYFVPLYGAEFETNLKFEDFEVVKGSSDELWLIFNQFQNMEEDQRSELIHSDFLKITCKGFLDLHQSNPIFFKRVKSALSIINSTDNYPVTCSNKFLIKRTKDRAFLQLSFSNKVTKREFNNNLVRMNSEEKIKGLKSEAENKLLGAEPIYKEFIITGKPELAWVYFESILLKATNNVRLNIEKVIMNVAPSYFQEFLDSEINAILTDSFFAGKRNFFGMEFNEFQSWRRDRPDLRIRLKEIFEFDDYYAKRLKNFYSENTSQTSIRTFVSNYAYSIKEYRDNKIHGAPTNQEIENTIEKSTRDMIIFFRNAVFSKCDDLKELELESVLNKIIC